MTPLPDRKAQVSLEVDRRLASLTDRLRGELKLIIGRTPPPAALLLDLEVHINDIGSTFPLYGAHYDHRKTQLDSFSFLTDVTCTVPDSLLSDDSPGATALEAWEAAFQTFVRWVARVWRAAGGEHYPLPVFICQHDDRESLDVKSDQWVKDDVKWGPRK